MTKKTSRIIATVMALGLIAFIAYAAGHPNASFPWDNRLTYSLYRFYIGGMVILFIAPFKNHSDNSED